MATLVSRVVGVPSSTVGRVAVRTTNATSVRLKVGTDTGVTTGVIFGSAVTPNAQGDSQLTVTGLSAGTQYYYRVEMTDSGGGGLQFDTGTVGKFKTAPTANTATSFAFNFASCATGDSASMSAIAARNDDLFFHLGDLYYHDGTGTTISNFRTRMSARIQLTNHQALFSTTPMTYTPSDHDGMTNNSAYGTDATAWTNWNQSYREMFPTPSLAGTMGVYYSFGWGRIRFIHIDTRSFKSNPADTDNSSKSALGATQKQWLKDEITNATEQVIVIIQDTPWIGSVDVGDDAWTGFTTERSELATFFQNSGKNIGMLAGDMHALAADDGTNAPGGIFVFHAAPLKGTSSLKGGPYTTGTYPTSSGSSIDQYGRVVVTDSGSQISLAFTGYSSDNTARVTLTKTFSVSSPSAPATPTGLTATVASNTQINLSWNSSSGATGYDLEVDGSIVDKSTSLTHSHTGLSAGSAHNYRVRARNANGNSAWSSIVSATTTGGGNNSTITLRGTGTAFNTATATSYVLSTPSNTVVGDLLIATMTIDALASTFTTTPPSGWTAAFTPVESTVGSIAHLVYWRIADAAGTANHTFTLSVTNKGSGNIVAFSGADSTTPFAGSTTAQDTGDISLSLSTPSSNDCQIIAGFAANHSGGTYSYSTPSGWTNDWVITGQQINSLYHETALQTTAAAASFSSTISPTASQGWVGWIGAIKPSTTSGPPTPTGLAATVVSSGQINVSWSSSTGATGYDLEVDGSIVDKGTSLTHSHTGLTANTAHSYRVRAKSAGGNSAWSSTVSATTLLIALTGTTTMVEQATGDSLVVTVPTGATVGEVLIAQIASTTNTVATPSGWTLFAQAANGVSANGYYRVVTGTESASYTWTGCGSDRSTGIMQRFSGVDTTSPIDVTATTSSTGSSTTLTLPSITTVTANALLLSAATIYSSTSFSLTVPTGMTAINSTTSGTGRRTTLAHEAKVTAGATGTRTWTEDPNTTPLQIAGWLTALRPITSPSAPTGLTGTPASTTQIDLSWNSVSGATGYDLEINGTIVDKGTSLTHSHTGLSAGTTHDYRVRAKNSAGTSAWSSAISATTNADSGIALVGTVSLAEQATGDSFVVNIPSGAQVGEVLIAQIGTTTTTVVGPSGWTLISQVNNTTSALSSSGYYRVVTGSESASYTWTGCGSNRSTGIIQRFSGVDTGSPIDVTPSTVATTVAATSVTVPTITTATNNAVLISGVTMQASSSTAIAPPASMTAIATSTGTGRRSTLAYEAKPTAGSTGTRVWTTNPSSAQHWAGWMTALRPLGPPSTPSGLTATAAGVSQINVSWNSSGTTSEYDLEVDSTVISVGSSLTYSHTGLAGNSTHNYRVRSENTYGVSAWSSTVSGTTNATSGGNGTITLKGIGTPFSTAAVTNYALSTPSNTAIGDLLIATMTIDELASAFTVTPPSGWTAAFTPLQSTVGSLAHLVYWRAAAAAGTATHTFTLSVANKGSGNIIAFSGADTTTPFAGSSTAQATGNISLSLSTPSSNNCQIIAGAAVNHAGTTYTYSTPSGWTNDWSITGQQMNMLYHENTLQTTATSASFSSTISPTNAQGWIGWIGAIKPGVGIPTRVTDVWDGATLIRQRIERWNGSALGDIVLEVQE